MFYYEINGYGAHKKLCEDILIWFIAKFYPRHKIDITVSHRGMKRDGAYGYCDIMGGERHPRTFLLELQSNMDKRLYALTLVHELVHVGQWIDGAMKLNRGKRIYRGITVDGLDYSDQPHEIEARDKEGKYLLAFVCDTGRVWTGL
jgi:hypothetical protein